MRRLFAPAPPVTPPPATPHKHEPIELALPTVLPPPTPAASPRPEDEDGRTDGRRDYMGEGATTTTATAVTGWHVDGMVDPDVDDDAEAAVFIASVAAGFPALSPAARRTFLSALLPLFSSQDLLHASTVIAPLLKRDFITELPQELGLKILASFEDPKDLVRASQVCRAWRRLVNDDQTWKLMCERQGFRATTSVNASAHVTPLQRTTAAFSRAAGASSNRLPGASEVEVNGRPTPNAAAVDDGLQGLGLFRRQASVPLPAVSPTTGSGSSSVVAALQRAAAGLGIGGSNGTPAVPSAPALGPSSPVRRLDRALQLAPVASSSRGTPTSSMPRPSPPPREFSHNPFGIGMTQSLSSMGIGPTGSESPNSFSYKTHFKRAYLTESNWLRGPGRLVSTQASTDDGVVTSLGFDSQWIVVGMATSKIHVFDADTGAYVRTLAGHELGVWCLTLVSTGGVRLDAEGKPVLTAASAKGKEPATFADDRDRAWATGRQFAADAHFAMADLDAALSSVGTAGTASGPASPVRHRRADSAVPVSPSRSRAPRSSHPAGRDEPRTRPRRPSSLTDFPPPRFETEVPVPPLPPLNGDGGLSAQQASVCGTARGWGQDGAVVVSGGCDRDVRVWDVRTGACRFVLRGHSSTIRCLKVLDGRPIAVSGSRDGTLRVWDIERGTCMHLLNGHQHSVRCIEVSGNKVVSGSYDTTCRVRRWRWRCG